MPSSNGSHQPVNQTAEQRINDPKFGNKMGFEQKTSYNAFRGGMKTKSSYYHKEYSIGKNAQLAKEQHRKFLEEKVRKASNPDQLTKFVTSFKLSTISDEKRSIAKNQADVNEKFVPLRDDVHRPENPAMWLSKESISFSASCQAAMPPFKKPSTLSKPTLAKRVMASFSRSLGATKSNGCWVS